MNAGAATGLIALWCELAIVVIGVDPAQRLFVAAGTCHEIKLQEKSGYWATKV
jgi:hypothetical protein